MLCTILKFSFINIEPKLLNFRDYKNFNFGNVKEGLCEALLICRNSHDEFENIFITALDKHAPIKKKWLRGNNKPHIAKPLRQAIMKRSKLKNKANKTKLLTDIRNYKKQRNYVVNLNKNAKVEYFNRNDCKDGKPFWVNCKPYFSNKHSKADNDIVLNKDGVLILKNKEIANIFNDYFGFIVENLNLEHWDEDSNSYSGINHRNNVKDIIKKYSNHPSIKNIKKKYKNINKNSFRQVTTDEIKKVIKDLKTSKSVGGEIPIQILKESEFTFECLKNRINHSIEETGIFLSSLKLGNITPIFKKDDPLDKSNIELQTS